MNEQLYASSIVNVPFHALRWDGHVHSLRSDGNLPPDAVCKTAKIRGLSVIALTDHNLFDETLAEELTRSHGIAVLPACEFSAMVCPPGSDHAREVHIIGLFLSETPEIRALLTRAAQNRKPYVLAHLRQLDALGVDLSGGAHDPERAYAALEADNPGSRHIGRMAIAKRMQKLGFVPDTSEAFSTYLGRNPGDKQLVRVCAEDYLHYPPMREVIRAIHSCGGVSVLCHAFYHRDPAAPDYVEQLVKAFREAQGDAMEVDYGRGKNAYSWERRCYLARLSEQYGLLPSAGSDFHNEGEDMMRGDPVFYVGLLERHRENVKKYTKNK